MRVVKDKEKAICKGCGENFNHSLEMYDLMIGDVLITVCDECTDEVLRKCCSASCKYNGRLKSKEDLRKISTVQKYRTGGKHGRS